MSYHEILGQVAEALWLASDTTITVSVNYLEESETPLLEYTIENHKGTYPLEQLELFNCILMTYDCSGYEPLSHTIQTVDMYECADDAIALEDFLAHTK